VPVRQGHRPGSVDVTAELEQSFNHSAMVDLG
jgi:hypothetical protein